MLRHEHLKAQLARITPEAGKEINELARLIENRPEYIAALISLAAYICVVDTEMNNSFNEAANILLKASHEV